jgi:hypothetical protein
MSRSCGHLPGPWTTRWGSSWRPASSRIRITPEAPAESAHAFSDVTRWGVRARWAHWPQRRGLLRSPPQARERSDGLLEASMECRDGDRLAMRHHRLSRSRINPMSPTKSVTRLPSADSWSFLKCSKFPRIRTSPLPAAVTCLSPHLTRGLVFFVDDIDQVGLKREIIFAGRRLSMGAD